MSQYSSAGSKWDRTKAEALKRDAYQCAVPGCTTPATTVDHIIPKSAGGTDDMENLQAMCRSHNSKKGAKQHVMHRHLYLNPMFITEVPK